MFVWSLCPILCSSKPMLLPRLTSMHAVLSFRTISQPLMSMTTTMFCTMPSRCMSRAWWSPTRLTLLGEMLFCPMCPLCWLSGKASPPSRAWVVTSELSSQSDTHSRGSWGGLCFVRLSWFWGFSLVFLLSWCFISTETVRFIKEGIR